MHREKGNGRGMKDRNRDGLKKKAHLKQGHRGMEAGKTLGKNGPDGMD